VNLPKRRKEQFPKDFKSVILGISSPEMILTRSRGEILKPETINYRTYKPEKDGLFCEKIFGPVKDWECHCGKYKRIRYKGIVCDRCGVEVTTKKVRRERTGHIQLAVPVIHTWFLRSIPSKISLLLGLKAKETEAITYYEKYYVFNQGKSQYPVGELLTEDEYHEELVRLGSDEDMLPEEEKFRVNTGSVAIYEFLKNLNITETVTQLREAIAQTKSVQKKDDLLKRLKIVMAFDIRTSKRVNNPEWMVISALPVIPPELRPLVPLDGGRFAASDLNDLYRRIIIRNNRLKQLMDIKAPDVILRNEKRMLQEAVDDLIDNKRHSTAIRSGTKRALKSIGDNLRGKQGRFRQNLLGKRVDYSGRSVIVVGPELRLHECGIPKLMAVELFKPMLLRHLIKRGYAGTPRSAKLMVEELDPKIFEVLEYVVRDHPVLLNRAPTLHRLGVQAFQPVLIDGRAIRIHPLVCAAFNADFDGDQMAVHVPLSVEAQMEARVLMLSSHNILHPAHGKPIAIPSQDMVLGCYYATASNHKKVKRENLSRFSMVSEVRLALDNKWIHLHDAILFYVKGEPIETTVGRVLFNDTLPEGTEFVNQLITKKGLEKLIGKIFKDAGNYRTVLFLDKLKDFGFYHATRAGTSIGLDDLIIPGAKPELLDKAFEKVASVRKANEDHHITDVERYNKVIDIWTHATNELKNEMMKQMKVSNDGLNPVFIMADSGARGSEDQIRQLAAMRGLMNKPQKTMTGGAGEIVESPILSNFKEGLSVLEYFISTHGARKGLADTALKTADAGYLTRRLVDVAQDVVIREDDCGSINGIQIEAIKDGEETIEPLSERIIGRFSLDDIHDRNNDLIIGAGEEIENDTAEAISLHHQSVLIRSVLTCETHQGVCVKCYGRGLTDGKVVRIGESVGIIAAQSIGEPGTQLTLRTFHIGGVASRVLEKSDMTSRQEGAIRYSKNLEYVVHGKGDEQVKIVLSRNSKIMLFDEDNREIVRFNVPYGANLLVDSNEKIKKGAKLFSWDPYHDLILAKTDGVVKYHDIVEGVTYAEEAGETGRRIKTIIGTRDRKKTPMISVESKNGDYKTQIFPIGANVIAKEKEKIKKGDILVKIPREVGKTRDITGGLPRVAELFEARRPGNPAVITEISGIVSIDPKIKRGQRVVIVTSHDGEDSMKYTIPYGRHTLVQEGDDVHRGAPLCEGAIDPHDILQVRDARAVQEFLVNGIQEVYRLQGVRINDKHIEVIVRQMMRKVKVVSSGDTKFLENDRINKDEFFMENGRIENSEIVLESGDSEFLEGDLVDRKRARELKKELGDSFKTRKTKVAIAEPLLLGITRASLNVESFISAASFQETSRVLTDAATRYKTDNLIGLKENVIIGRLIPAGTGQSRFSGLRYECSDDSEDFFPPLEEDNEVDEKISAKVE